MRKQRIDQHKLNDSIDANRITVSINGMEDELFVCFN
jgi:hypothetical protein